MKVLKVGVAMNGASGGGEVVVVRFRRWDCGWDFVAGMGVLGVWVKYVVGVGAGDVVGERRGMGRRCGVGLVEMNLRGWGWGLVVVVGRAGRWRVDGVIVGLFVLGLRLLDWLPPVPCRLEQCVADLCMGVGGGGD